MNIELTKVIYEISTQTKSYNIEKILYDNWDIEAYDIPRNCLSYWKYTQLNTKHPNLHYHGIYFLVSTDNKQVYVGKGTDVIKRVHGHEGSKAVLEPYYNNWNRVIIFISKYRVGEHYLSWDDSTISALESFMMQEVKNKFNQVIPSNGGNNRQAFEELIEQIKIILKALGIDENIFNNDVKYKISSIASMTKEVYDKYNKFEYIGNNTDKKGKRGNISQIVTPKRVVKAMVDMLPDEVWNDTTVFLDPVCKSGEYLREIFDRLMAHKTLKDKYPNVTIRTLHILTHQLYGIALDEKSKEQTIDTLSQGVYDTNIKVIPKDEIKTILKDNKLKEKIKEVFNSDMKFDVVISNPPYQDSNGSGNGGGGTPLYDKFVLNAFEMDVRFISFITPARWYTNNSKVQSLREKLLTSNKITKLYDYPNAKALFSGVDIMGGLCYYLIDKNYNGDCKVIEHDFDGNILTKSVRPLHEIPNAFIRDSRALSVLRKVGVTNSSFRSFRNLISDYNIFGLRSYTRGNTPCKDAHNNIKLYYTGNECRGGGSGYISAGYIPKEHHLIGKHKVFINSVSDNMLSFPFKVLYKAFYGEPNSICTESYLTIVVSSEDEANKIINYLATKFVRFLVQQKKTSQTAYKEVYTFVPQQDFTSKSDIDWSKPIPDINKQLYNKYNLTQEEIAYIENTILPID